MKQITTGMISKEKIEEFRELYFRKYGVMLTPEQNTDMALGLVNIMRVLTKPEPKEPNK